MENGVRFLDIAEIENYTQKIIPNIENKLRNTKNMSSSDIAELYKLYVDVLRIVAPYDFITFNKFLEIEEDASDENRKFYWHRRFALEEAFVALNDMEIYNKYDTLLLSCPPRVGKTTTGIRFLAWIIGRHPETTQLAISYSDSITTSFYIGVMEIVQNEKFKLAFPESKLVKQNAKREEIWLKRDRRYPSISFVPINGSMTGRAEAGNYLYCDDLVSGIEEAMSPTRLEKLWQTYTVNAKQRKKKGCKEIHICTRWSVHDPATRLENEKSGDPRCKVIKLSCYDENGESAFDYMGGFDTAYYKDQEQSMDEISFNALYKQEPIEREGLLYHKDELEYYFDLPKDPPDTVVAICDSKNLGRDSVSSPVGYVYGDKVYIEDVVFNNGLPDVTRPLVANMWIRHNVVRGDVELNNGGNYYAEDLDELIKSGGGNTSVRVFYTSTNKITKIVSYADFVKTHFVFKHESKYKPNSEYAKFMREVFSFTQTGKNAHDDAPDALAMLAQLVQELQGCTVKILDRRLLGI